MAKNKKEIEIVHVSGQENLVELCERINLLFDALSLSGKGRNITPTELVAILSGFHFHLYLVQFNGKMVGMGSLYFRQTLSRHTAYVEDVVILPGHQGMGLGKMLMSRLIYEARQNNVDVIELTSNPARIAANALYQKIGFVQYETNLYRMYL